MSRPKQSRRIPQSVGSITALSPIETSPRPQAVHEYTHHSSHSNTSLQNLGSAAGVTAQERIVKSLMDKLIAKMPSYSGISLSALEMDEPLNQVHEALLQLSRHCANIIVWSLCEILDKLQKRHVGPETSLDVLESEIYIIRVLSLILNFRSNIYVEERAQNSNDAHPSTSHTLPSKQSDSSLGSSSNSALVEPPALEDNVAKYCLVVMLGFIRRSGPTKADAIKDTGKLDTLNILHDFESFQMDAAVLHATRRMPYKLDVNLGGQAVLGSSAMAQPNHSMASFSSPGGGVLDVASHIPSAAAVRSSTFSSDAPVIITHLAGKVIFYLSASNWQIVFSRIRKRIHYFAANIEDEGLDIVDLRLLTYSGIDKNRLVQVLQELSSLLVNVKSSVQGAVAVALRTVVWKWIEDFPDEFTGIVQSSRRELDGQPERVIDLLYVLMDQTKKHLVWPTLAVLVAISPDRLKAAEAALNSTLKFGRKHNNYLEHLHSAITTQLKLGEVAVQCYNDICRAAYYLPQNAGDTVLRSLARDFADELKSRLMNPPFPAQPFYESADPIDVTMYGDTLVVLLRYHPVVALVGVLPACLDLERSAAVKLCVVRALTILVTEAPKFPWQPALDKSIYKFVAPKLRAIAKDLSSPRSGHFTARPLSAKDGPPGDDIKELILSLHALWRLDFGFFFTNMTEEEYKPLIDSFLKVLKPPKDEGIQVSTLRCIGAFLAKVSSPHDEYFELVKLFMYHAYAPTLRAAAEELFRVTDDYEENQRCMNMIVAILSQLADRTLEGRQAWKYAEQRELALSVVETALLIHLVSPRLDLSSLAAKAVRLVVIIEQDTEAAYPLPYTPEQASIRAPLFEVLGDPKMVFLGRVEFQKKMRTTCSARAFPCVIHQSAWKEVYYRWLTLKPVITGAAARSSTDILASNGSSSGTQAFEDKQMEWENMTLTLASASGACLVDDPAFNTPSEYGIPHRKDITDQKATELAKAYIRELINLLTNPCVPARIVARDALGTEMNPQMFPYMFEHLDVVIGDMFGEDGDYFGPQDQDMVVFADQVISIFKLIMDRVRDVGQLLIKVDLGESLQALARFIHRGAPNTSERRIKARFCALVDNILEKRDILRIRQESVVRNCLLDIISDWVLEYPNEWAEDDVMRKEQLRTQKDSNLAALKTCVNLLENLRLHAYDGSTGSESAHVVSRLFHRYFNIFVLVLELRSKELESMESDQVSQQGTIDGKHDVLIQELVISGIANMLHANTDAGTKHVLTLGYKDNPRLRAVFAHVFCRVLSRGTKFDTYLEGLTQTSRKSRLCEMVKESEIIAQAIIDVCPMSDVDTIIPVLMNIYDTRITLLNLLKMIIRRQVEITGSDTELFRSNDMCSRILSAFAKLHGYSYLRSIMTPLITLMLELPPGRGFELDPTKLRPDETQEENAETLKMITKAFLAVISESVNAIPPIIREVCRYIEDSVTAVWPESRYAAVGAFIFLRFIVPAIVAPETVDIELPRNDPRAMSMRRGLLLVAKIIQNLANNIMFGKEAHMMMLNPFLTDNIVPVTRFHSDILKIPTEETQSPDTWLGTSYDETDTIILHRFFQKNADKIGKVLLSLSRMTNSHETVSMSGKRTWDTVVSLLVEMGAALEPPSLIDQSSSQHKIFRAFMLKNAHRNTDSVRDIFQSTMALKDQRPLFILSLSKINVETVDLELLMCHIFKTIREKTAFEQPFDVIIECTAFTSASEVPISWCKLCMEHLPSDLRQNFETAYILNTNAAAQKFLRKLYHVCSEARFPNTVIAVSSIAELAELVHPGSLTPMSYSTTVESEHSISFQCHQLQRNLLRIPIVMQIGISHIRITSVKTQPIYPSLSSKTVEIIPLVDIGDVCIVSSRNDSTEFLIRRSVNGSTVTFSSQQEREEIVKTIRLAKGRLQASRPLIPAERSPRLADVSAALLNVGLLNVCDEDESLRGAAYDLLFAVCSYVNYEANPLVPLRGPFIPSNTAAFILPFSERLANFVPQLTLDLISEFSVGFEKASTAQKITCLQYLHPWIKNMTMFARPTDPNYDHTGGKLRESICLLIDITVKFPDVYPTLQRSVWTELGRHDNMLLNIALEELMRAAIDGGLGSQRCEQIADTLIAMSSINVRAKVLMKLRRVVSKASSKSTRSLTQSPTWNEISALARLALVAGFSPRLAVQNLLFVPEIAHLTTMLCATGNSTMKRTIYGLAMSLVQSLHIACSEDERSGKDLKKILDNASQPDTLQKFGLVRAHASSEYTSMESSPDQIPITALEGITELLIEALTHGAHSLGLLNVWRSRWMSLVTATAFQICPYIQYRAFVVLGLLASTDTSEVDDDLLYQMLVAFKNALATSVDSDFGPVTSMLRCIAKVIPGLGSDSRYLPQVFWLAVALLQSTYLPLYGEAARLLEVTLEVMARQGLFKARRMSAILLEARLPLTDTTTQLDTIMGLSFETGFSFSLASIIFRGVRPPAVRPIAKGLLKTVLRIAAESSTEMENNSDAPPVPLDHDVLGYFLALLPFASTSGAYRELLKVARVGTRWWPPLSPQDDMEDDTAIPRVSTDIFGFSSEDRSTPLLVISFIFAMLNSYQGSEQEKEVLFSLLAQLAQIYPDLCASAVVHYLVNPRSEWLLSNLTETSIGSPETASAVQVLFRTAMTSPAWSAAAASSAMSPHESDPSIGQRTPHYKALEDLDMHALSGTWQFLPKSNAEKVLQWIPLLVDAIID